MSLLESIKLLAGKIGPGSPHTSRAATDSECPHEAVLLAYSQDRLSHRRREQLESHFLICDDCRDFLALFARSSDDATQPDISPLTDSMIKNQAARILTYIKEDEFNRRQTGRNQQPTEGVFLPNSPGSSGAGFFVSTRQLVTIGLMVCTFAVATVWFLTRGAPRSEVAMEAVALGTKDKRRLQPRLSGGFNHSPYDLATRNGGVESEDPKADLQFDRAQAQVQFAEDASASAKDRLTLARVYLARGDVDYTLRALAILEQLVAGPDPSPEALNETGVALHQLKRFPDAIIYFDRALEKAPGFDEALFNRALAEQESGNEAKAREDWKQFIEVSSDEKWKNEARRLMK